MPINTSGRYRLVPAFERSDNEFDSIIKRAQKHGYRDLYIYWRQNHIGNVHYELTDGRGQHLAWSVASNDQFLLADRQPLEFNWNASDLLCLL